MARAQHKKAGKDYPDLGIKKGDMYWYADVKTGPRSKRVIRSIKPIPRSQLTGSAFLSTAYDLSDRLDQCADLEDIKSGFEDLGSECQDSLDNMPEGLQQGATGELLQERIDQCESIVSEIDDAVSSVEDARTAEDDEHEEGDAEESEPFDETDAVRAAIEGNVSSQF